MVKFAQQSDKQVTQSKNTDVVTSALAVGSPARTKGTGRRQRRAAETRLKLFRVAISLFAERGLSNVTVEDITEAADVGKGTFFNYFPTKDHVLGVMVEIQGAHIREAAELGAEGKQSIHSVLHGMALRFVEEPGRSPELARALVSSFLASDVVRDLLESQMSTGRTIIADLVERGQRRGEIDPNLKKKAVALHFQQAVIGTILLWSLHGKPSLTKWIEDSFQHFWRAIAIQKRDQEP